jgi:hypothetical protein
MYKCNNCKKTFEFNSLYIRHKSKKIGCKTLIIDYDLLIQTNENKLQNIKTKINDLKTKITSTITNSLIIKTNCLFCNKIFKTKGNLNRHINTSCIEKNQIINEENILQEELNKLEEEKNILEKDNKEQNKIIEQEKERKRDEENKELKAMIEKLLERQPIQPIQNITNNNINQTNNVIMINNFGNENLSHITLQDYKKYFSTYFKGFLNFIEKVHFDENMPENHNICLTNLKSKDIKVYEGDKWIAKPKTDVIDKFLRKKLNTLIDKCEELEETDQIADKVVDKFSEFQNNYMDDKAKKNTKDDVILMIYNNKDKVKVK